MATGAYILRHRKSGKFYIGSASYLSNRKSSHKMELIRGEHPNKALQAVYTCWEDFEWVTYPTDSVESARKEEQRLLDLHRGSSLCCNIAHSSTDMTLGVITAEIRRRTHTGNTYRRGSTHTEETRAKMSDSLKGKIVSPDTRAAISVTKSRAVLCGGVRYESVRLAAEALGIPYNSVVSRIVSTSKRFENWQWIQK